MPENEPTFLAEAKQFLDELILEGKPLQQLLNYGMLPDGWAERYMAFIAEVETYYGDSLPLPRDVMAVIFNASVYCTKRYYDWQHRTNDSNPETERLVTRIRWAGDKLVLGPYWRLVEEA